MFKMCIAILLCSSMFAYSSESERADVKEVLKVSPLDILAIRSGTEKIQDAKYQPITTLPPALSDTTELRLTVNESKPVVYVFEMNPTSVEFVDMTGAPWPIAEAKSFNGSFIEVKKVVNNFENSMWINPLLPKGEALIGVFLKDLQTNISFVAVANKEKFHSSKVIKIMRLGPNAVVDRTTSMLAVDEGQETDEDLLSAAYGIRPADYHELETKNTSVKAWENGKEVLIFTSLDPIAPAPLRIKTGSNDWRAYRIPMTSRITFSNKSGSVVEVVLEKPYARK